MINFDNCKFVVWGFTFENAFHTHSFIHNGFFRTLSRLGKEVLWLDQASDIRDVDFSNTFFITEHTALSGGSYWPSSKERISELPLQRKDCFYFVHGDNERTRGLLGEDEKNWLVWDVFINQRQYNTPKKVLLDKDMPYYPELRRVDMRWATDLMPDEILSNKPTRVINPNSQVINYVGSKWFVNDKELNEFATSCNAHGIDFKMHGSHAHNFVTLEENMKLVQDSYFAPAIVGSHHITEGYLPCRILKNISYGCPGITNSQYVHDFFDVKPILETDISKLFDTAESELNRLTLDQLYAQMHEVAENHTYVSRINKMVEAAKMQMDTT